MEAIVQPMDLENHRIEEDLQTVVVLVGVLTMEMPERVKLLRLWKSLPRGMEILMLPIRRELVLSSGD